MNPLDLAKIISGQTATQVSDLFGQKIAATQQAGQISADQAAAVELAKANAISLTKNFFEGQGGVDKISELTTDYMQTSTEARLAHRAASEQLARLNEQASTSFFDSPFTWLGNQLTFGDDYNAAQVAVSSANSKTQEAASIKDQMITLNNVTQEVAATTLATAETSTAKSAERLAALAKYNADSMVLDTKLKAIETGADLQVKAMDLQFKARADARADQQMAMAQETQAIQRQQAEMAAERFQWDKAKFEEWAAEKQAEPVKVKAVWDAALAGVKKLKSVDDATARKMLGPMPQTARDLDLYSKKNPAFDAYARTGFLALSESPVPYGGTVSEVAETLLNTQATGNAQNKKVVDYIKARYIQGYNASLATKVEDKKRDATVAVTQVLQGMVNVDAVDKDTNPLRLPAPIVALQGGYTITDTRVKDKRAALLASPIVQHLQTSGVLAKDDPMEVLKAAAAYGNQKGISPTLVAQTLANLNSLSADYHGSILAEHGLPADLIGKVKYKTALGTLWGTVDYSPYNPEVLQKFVIRANLDKGWKEVASKGR